MDMEKMKRVEASRRRVVSWPGIDEALLNLAVDRLIAAHELTDSDINRHAKAIGAISAPSYREFKKLLSRFCNTFGEAPGSGGSMAI